jgi:succinate dehydrogenase / fumarate reductase cytochrome b subunit
LQQAKIQVRLEMPEFRNIHVFDLMKYRLPWAGKVSILHRVSGLLMFLLIPFVLYLFEQSITSEVSFSTFKSVLAHPISKLIVLALIWSYLHHFCAGIRFLVLDLHMGIDKASAAKSAVVVLIVSLTLTAVCAGKLFGLF